MDRLLKFTVIFVSLLYHPSHRCIKGAVTLLPPGLAPVCRGDQLNLTCTTTGSLLQWRFSIIRGNETAATEFSRTIRSSGGTLSPLEVDSTIFKFSRTSIESNLPVMSTLLISPVSNDLNGTVINCEDLDTAELSSTTVIIRERNVNVIEQAAKFEDDGVTITLEWDQLNPLYSTSVTVTPETQVNINASRSIVKAHLIFTYNVMYNVSVMISHLCGRTNVTLFSEVYYYNSVATCESPKAQVYDSVSVLGYMSPAVEGATMTFHCPPGLVLDGILTCMENGEWSMALHTLNCTGSSKLLKNDTLGVDVTTITVTVASSVSVFVVTSFTFFIFGFLCGHCHQKEKKVNNAHTACQPENASSYYDHNNDQELNLEENVAYAPGPLV